jgi:hypothetical protein
LLEDEATAFDRAKGFNIADFIISELKFPSMIEGNKELPVLINGLDLQEV